MRKIYLCIIICLLTSSVNAQDSARILTPRLFLRWVQEYHPIARNARLQPEIANTEVMKAKGEFDPIVAGSVDQKYFEGKTYYSLVDYGIAVPTRLGVDFVGGISKNEGLFINDQNNLPPDGIIYGGVSVPLGKGLFIDQRRKALQQARVLSDAAESERQLMLNELMYDALNAYLNWYESYHKMEALLKGVELAKQRMKAVTISAQAGDKPAVDTLEAGIQVQARNLTYQEGLLDYQNATLWLNTFLWNADYTALELTPVTRPSPLADSVFTFLVSDSLAYKSRQADLYNPQTQLYRYDVRFLQIERKWNREMLKPKLNLNYYPLADRNNSTFNLSNYKWGVDVGMPLFLRKERGALEKTNLMIKEKEWALQQNVREVNGKADMYLNQINNLAIQISIYQRNVTDTYALLQAELRKFEAGESSLFLVNAREVNYLNAAIKRVETFVKRPKAVGALLMLIGGKQF